MAYIVSKICLSSVLDFELFSSLINKYKHSLHFILPRHALYFWSIFTSGMVEKWVKWRIAKTGIVTLCKVSHSWFDFTSLWYYWLLYMKIISRRQIRFGFKIFGKNILLMVLWTSYCITTGISQWSKTHFYWRPISQWILVVLPDFSIVKSPKLPYNGFSIVVWISYIIRDHRTIVF